MDADDVADEIPAENYKELKGARNVIVHTDLGGTLTLFFNVREVFDRPDPRGCCAFHTRCAWALERCRTEVPPLRSVADGHRVACFLIASKSVGDELFDHNLR